MAQVELFIKLFTSLSSSRDVEIIFNFRSECLARDDAAAGDDVREIVTQFIDPLMDNLASETVSPHALTPRIWSPARASLSQSPPAAVQPGLLLRPP